jgi:hypothetical protein
MSAKLTDVQVKAIIEEAQKEAGRFAKAYIEQNGEHFPCGFAWVNIKPARGQFVKVLKEMKLGDTAYDGGFTVWNPSANHTQCMDAKQAGAVAFANALKKHGVDANAYTRLD